METLDFKNIMLYGELSYRIGKNYARLESKCYRPEAIFTADQSGWPADWEGRTILALVLLARISGREPAYLDAILEALPEKLNAKGYLGRILPIGDYDEQQLAGHNWLLRGLLEYYKWKKDRQVLKIIKNIVNHLYLPLTGRCNTYPVNPEQRVFAGEAAGNLDGSKVGSWYTSTDIGCAFLSFDGLSEYYEMFGDEKAGRLLAEMADTFMGIDFIGLSMQTHSSLSAARGILRFYQSTGDKKYLDFTVKLFNLYITQAMTENYANYNWFNRSSWTEPCAIVDSYLLALGLYKNTLNPCYLETAQKIYYNALCYAQRPNGGFGCDTCSGASDAFVSPQIFEAFWCCTMRGGAGLSRHAENLIQLDNDDICVIDYSSGVYKCPDMVITVKTDYPYEGSIHLLLHKIRKNKRIKLFIPSCYQNFTVKVDGKPIHTELADGFITIPVTPKDTTEIELNLDIQITKLNTVNVNTIKGYSTYWHGVLLLGAETRQEIHFSGIRGLSYCGKGSYIINSTQHMLRPLTDMIDLESAQAESDKRQILFP